MIRINDRTVVGYDELRFITSRSSGPGGQHVNTTDTRVTLLFDVEGSPNLTETQKATLKAKFGRRLDKQGVLQVTSQKHRSQKANKDEAIERFVELMQWALAPVTRRKATRVPLSAKRKRLDRKRRTARRKQDRKLPDISGEY